MNNELNDIIDAYYNVLGITPNRTRYSEQVQCRAALMSAMRQFETTTSIGKAFNVDHSTVVYHTSKHEANMNSWLGYDRKFDIANKLCNETLRYKTIHGKLKSVQIEIRRLKTIENKLIEHIENRKHLLNE